jgi:hypothetical protein
VQSCGYLSGNCLFYLNIAGRTLKPISIRHRFFLLQTATFALALVFALAALYLTLTIQARMLPVPDPASSFFRGRNSIPFCDATSRPFAVNPSGSAA